MDEGKGWTKVSTMVGGNDMKKKALALVKDIEKKTGCPTQITVMWPDRKGDMKKLVFGSFAERKQLFVRFNKSYKDWQSLEMVQVPKKWRLLETSIFHSIKDIKLAIQRLLVEDLTDRGVELQSHPGDKKSWIYKCPKCGSWGGETEKCGYNRLFPVSMCNCCQNCGEQTASTIDYGVMGELMVVGNEDHGFFLAIEGPNMGSAGGPTYIRVGRIVFQKL